MTCNGSCIDRAGGQYPSELVDLFSQDNQRRAIAATSQRLVTRQSRHSLSFTMIAPFQCSRSVITSNTPPAEYIPALDLRRMATYKRGFKRKPIWKDRSLVALPIVLTCSLISLGNFWRDPHDGLKKEYWQQMVIPWDQQECAGLCQGANWLDHNLYIPFWTRDIRKKISNLQYWCSVTLPLTGIVQACSSSSRRNYFYHVYEWMTTRTAEDKRRYIEGMGCVLIWRGQYIQVGDPPCLVFMAQFINLSDKQTWTLRETIYVIISACHDIETRALYAQTMCLSRVPVDTEWLVSNATNKTSIRFFN